MDKPKVGVVCFGRTVYPDPRGTELLGRAKAAVARADVEAYLPPSVPMNVAETVELALQVRRQDVDCVVAYLGIYPSEELPMVFARELVERPILIWSHSGTPRDRLSIPGLVTTAGNLRHLGLPAETLTGDPEDPATPAGLERFARVARALKCMRRSASGVVGHPNPGMVDVCHSEFHLRRLAPGMLLLDCIELLERFREVALSEAEAVAARVVRTGASVEVPQEEIVTACRAYLATRAMATSYSLQGITIREWPELSRNGFTMCLASALLNDEGLVCVQEADASSMLTAMLLAWVGAGPAYVGEVASVDVPSNTLTLFHEGATPLSLLRGPGSVTLTYSRVSVERFTGRRGGVVVQGALRPGRVTVAKLSGRPLDDRLRLAVLTGECLDQDPGYPGSGSAVVRTDTPVSAVMDGWVREGFEHHMVVARGDFREELSLFGRLAGVEVVRL